MEIKLARIVTKRKKRVGRGMGSGKGSHTVGRGQKGQKSRDKIGVVFEGMKTKKSLIKKMPFLRGRDKFKAHPKPEIVHLGNLNIFESGTVVDTESLISKKLVDTKRTLRYGVKILSGGEINKKLTVTVRISKGAAREIVNAGGKVETK